ncbi:uncharacterized protein LOC118458735 [Anopheles albimanus]|uniref:Uncharacterized protein n=1 Tax=Anopheles albimanus TaxID=7167 RepID=A0A182FPU9_ANOAL|nr:uncharacterized protein LOC118458735 [Anopheles albimanus]
MPDGLASFLDSGATPNTGHCLGTALGKAKTVRPEHPISASHLQLAHEPGVSVRTVEENYLGPRSAKVTQTDLLSRPRAKFASSNLFARRERDRSSPWLMLSASRWMRILCCSGSGGLYVVEIQPPGASQVAKEQQQSHKLALTDRTATVTMVRKRKPRRHNASTAHGGPRQSVNKR